jgi:hypothetical protein
MILRTENCLPFLFSGLHGLRELSDSVLEGSVRTEAFAALGCLTEPQNQQQQQQKRGMASDFDHLYLNEEKRKEASFVPPPYIDAKYLLVNGELVEWTGSFADVKSPIIDRASGTCTIRGISIRTYDSINFFFFSLSMQW